MLTGLGGPSDKDRPPWAGSAEPVNGVVRTPEPDGPGGPGVNNVVCVSGPDGAGGPCDEDRQPRTVLRMVTFLRVLL